MLAALHETDLYIHFTHIGIDAVSSGGLPFRETGAPQKTGYQRNQTGHISNWDRSARKAETGDICAGFH